MDPLNPQGSPQAAQPASQGSSPQDSGQAGSASRAAGSPLPKSWIWDALGRQRERDRAPFDRVDAIEGSGADPTLKSFLHFQELAGKDPSDLTEQPDGPAGQMLRERYARAKGHPEEEALTYLGDELLQGVLGKDPTRSSYLPGPPEEGMNLLADRLFRAHKANVVREGAIFDLPEAQQMKDWLKANPNGRFEKLPDYMQANMQATEGPGTGDIMAVMPPAGMAHHADPATEIQRILSVLNGAYRQGVNPRGSVMQGALTGEMTRKLGALTLPHPFDDAPLLAKLGVGIADKFGSAAITAVDTSINSMMDISYAAAKITRNLLDPGKILPEWMENNYHPGMIGMSAYAREKLGLASVPWDDESKQYVSQEMFEKHMTEDMWMRLSGATGMLVGFVANPVMGMKTMGAAASGGAQLATGGVELATKGAAWLFGTGAKVAPQYQRLAALLGAVAGTSAFTGVNRAIEAGEKGPLTEDGKRQYERGFVGAFLDGAAMGPLMMAAGAMGSNAGTLLLRARMPTVVARAIQGGIEGAGFATMDEHARQAAWNVMRNPNKETWGNFVDTWGAHAMSMSLFHLVHTSPQSQMREKVLRETGVDIHGSDMQKLQEQAAKEQETQRARAAVQEAQVTDPQAPFSELFFQQRTTREQREQLAEQTRKMGQRAREEYEIERRTGVATEPLTAPSGTPREAGDLRTIARDAPLRALEWNRRRVLKEGPEAGKEFGGFVVFGKEGVEDFQTKRAPTGVAGKLPMEKTWKAMKEKSVRVADWHTHPNDSFFSGTESDLGIFKSMRDMYEASAPEEVKQARVPFITVGTGHFLVATKTPGVEMPAEAQIAKAYKASSTGAAIKQHATAKGRMEELGGKVPAQLGSDMAARREALLGRAEDPSWGNVGLEMNVYTPREFQTLWRNYIDTGEWLTRPEEIPHYAEEIAKRREVLGESRVTEGVYPDIGEFKPSPIEKKELAREPDVEGFTRTAREVTGEELPESTLGARQATTITGVERPELTGEQEGLYHAEPELPHAQAGQPLTGKFDPKALAKGEEKLQALFHRGKDAQDPGLLRRTMTATSSYIKEVFRGQRSLMKDVKQGRLTAAEALDKLGYRWRFRKLGEFEDRFVAETDRLATEVAQASRTAGQRLFDALAPLGKIGGEGVEKGQLEARQKATDDVMEYLYLKDFRASAERGEQLPLDLGKDQVETRLGELEGSLSTEQHQAAENVRALLSEAGEQLVRRGVLRREDLRTDYMPHKVADFFDAFSSFTPGRTVGKLRRPFAGYSRAREGSDRMLDTRPEALNAYLTQVQKDNAIHDFIRRNGEAVHSRMEQVLQNEGVNVNWKKMSGQQWADARKDFADRGLVVYDARSGELGRRNLTQDPMAQAIYRFFADKGEMQMPSIPELGKNVKPDLEKQVYLVPKEVADLWLDIRAPKKSIASSPILNQARRVIGAWYKLPALRGILGLGTIPRQMRNIPGDLAQVAAKKTLAETLQIIKRLPEGSRISRAIASPEFRKSLDPSEEGFLQEMERHGTVGAETQESYTKEAYKSHPTFKKIYGDWDKWWNPRKHLQGDYAWVRAVDNYSENLFRTTVWLHERSKLIQQGMDAEAAVRGAHLEVGRVLVNYNHKTPFEANIMNTVVFPFYTWTRHTLTSTMAEGMRHPLTMMAKYGAMQAALATWNFTFAQDEESKLIQNGSRHVLIPHLWLPWIKDSEGNPFMLSLETPIDVTARFLGIGGATNKVGDYLFGHGDHHILWRDLAAGGMEESALTGGRALQDWLAPWMRALAGYETKGKFTTPGEMVGGQLEKGASLFRPIGDVQRMFDDRRSLAQRITSWLPPGKFVDMTQGVPARHRQLEYYSGRQQRHESQLSNDVHDWTPKVSRLLKAQDLDGARKIIDKVWAQWADELAPLGYTQEHLANKFWNSVQRQWRKEAWEQQEGPAGSRFFSLSERQRVQALREMGYYDDEEEPKD